jgi:uncharacterized protein DUF4349
MRRPAVGENARRLTRSFDHVVEAKPGPAKVAHPGMDVHLVVEDGGRQIANVALDSGRIDAVLVPEPTVSAPEAGQVRDPGDLEPDEVDGVVHHTLRIRLAEANPEVGSEAEVVHGAGTLAGERESEQAQPRGGLMRRLLSILFLCVTAMALAACSGDDSGSGASGDSGGAVRKSSPEAAGTVSGGGGSLAADPTGQSTLEELRTPGIGPRIIKMASVRLSVRRGEFQGAVDEARTIAAAAGGFVVSSSQSQREKRLMNGSLVLRVPERRYESVMRDLGDVGRLDGRREEAQEVSAEFVDLQSRKRHLEAVERQLLILLERANSVPAALAVQSKLNDTQLQLEETRGRLRYLEDQTSFATISVSLRERLPVAAAGKDGVVETWKDGAEAFAHVAGRTFVAVATIAPILLLLGLAALGARFVVRRRVAPGGS